MEETIEYSMGLEVKEMLDDQAGYDVIENPEPVDVPSEETAERTSGRLAFGFSDIGLSKEQARAEILAGNEENLRARITAQADKFEKAFQKAKAMDIIRLSKEGRIDLTPEDIGQLDKIFDPGEVVLPNPSVYPEQRFANKVVDTATSADGDESQFSVAQRVLETGKPQMYQGKEVTVKEAEVLKKYSESMATREIVSRVSTNIIDRYKREVGVYESLGQHLKMFIPGYTEYNLNDALVDSPYKLPGNNKQDQIEYLYSLPIDQAEAVARTALNKIYEYNPALAALFASQLHDYDNTDVVIDNLFLGLDFATLPILSSARGAKALAKSIRNRGSVPGMLDASGNVAEAALRDMITLSRTNALKTGATKDAAQELEGILQPIFNVDNIVSDASLSRQSPGFLSRLLDQSRNTSSAILSLINTIPVNVARLEPGSAALREALDEAQELVAKLYPSTRSRVMAIAPESSAKDILTNTEKIVFHLGQRGGLPFESDKQAKSWGRRNLKTEHEIITNPDGSAYIALRWTLDETTPRVMNAAKIDALADATPHTMFAAARTADETLSNTSNKVRTVAMFSSETLATMMNSFADAAIRPLSRSSRRDLNTFMTDIASDVQAQSAKSVAGPQAGPVPTTIGHFERKWLRRFQRMPTENETLAYFRMMQVESGHLYANNLGIATRKFRLGIRNFAFPMPDMGRAALKELKTDIEGRPLAKMDWDKPEDAGIVILPETKNDTIHYVRKKFSSKTNKTEQVELETPFGPETIDAVATYGRDHIDELIKKGWHLVQLSPEGKEPFKTYLRDLGLNAPRGDVTYVLSRNTRSSPIGLKHLPDVPGGRTIYKDEFLVAQPQLVQVNIGGGAKGWDYSGDLNLMTAPTRLEAQAIAKHMEVARKLFIGGKAKKIELKNYLNENLPDLSYKNFVRLFVGKTAIFDKNIPFYFREARNSVEQTVGLSSMRDEKTGELLYRNFTDVRNNSHNIWNDDEILRFASEKGVRLSRGEIEGSLQAPVIRSNIDAPVLDAFEALRLSGNAVMRGKIMDDYRTQAATRFVAEFGDLLDNPLGDLTDYPLRALIKGQFKTTGVDSARVAAAKNYRRTALELLGLDNRKLLDSNWWAEQSMKMLGVKFTKNARVGDVADWISEADPVQFLRKWFGFYPRLGFFNPKQLFLQAQGIANTALIEGADRTIRAMGAAWFMRPVLLHGDEKMLDAMAKKAVEYNKSWTVDEFKESYKALMRSGWWRIGGEQADRHAVLGGELFSSGIERAADKSLVFFRMGERANRLTAWNAAYLRWKAANPLVELDDRGIAEILDRADLLTLNMNKKSRAIWQTGPIAVMTQFWTAQHRLWDLTIGRRLTDAERKRLIIGQVALYGAPVAATASVVPFYPVHKELKEELREAGYDVNDDMLAKIAVDGIPQTMLHSIFGVDVPFADEYGLSGISLFKDIWDQQKNVMEIFGGAAGSTMWQSLEAFSPLGTALVNIGNGSYPLTTDDFTPILQIPSTASNLTQSWYIFNQGEYFLKNGQEPILDELNPWYAFTKTVFGLGPEGLNDFFTDTKNKKETEKMIRYTKDQMLKYFKLAMDKDTSPEDTAKYLKKVEAYFVSSRMTAAQYDEVLKEFMTTQDGLSAAENLEQRMRTIDRDRYNKAMEKFLGIPAYNEEE